MERVKTSKKLPGISTPGNHIRYAKRNDAWFITRFIRKDHWKFCHKAQVNIQPPVSKNSSGESVLTDEASFEESSLRAGWQTRFEHKHVFAQINLLGDFEHVYYAYHRNSYGPVPEKHNDFSANYIVLGFQPSIKGKSALSAVSFFLQARNLFMTKQLAWVLSIDHYAGIGVNVSF